MTVFGRSSRNGSPNSYGLVTSIRSPGPPPSVQLVLADLVLLQLLEDIGQRLLADLADTLRRQFVAACRFFRM